jgi:putative ABC transport system permease protein
VADQSMTFTDALWTVAFGLTVSFLSSLMPALESATVRPMESARAGTFERTSARRQRIFSMAGVILIFSGAVLIGIDYRFVPFSFPWLSHAGILLFILGCTLLAPAYLGLSLAVLNRPLRRLFKTVAPIAIADMAGTRFRFSLALMSVAVSSALIIAIVSSVFSLKQSFIYWINTYVSADVYVKAASCTSNFCYDPLPDKIFKIIARQPGVETVGRFRSLPVNFAGKRVVAGFGDSTLLWQRQAGVTTAEQERLQRLAQRPEVIVSEYLAVQYGLRRGDQIKLQTPKGMINFVVNNSSISYSTMSGFLYFDRKWLREYWEMDDATQLSVYLEKERDVPEFINRLRTTLAAEYALDITDNRELREAAIRIFDRSFAVTYSIELIAITISLIGVVNALMILVLERKRQISILRYLGSGWDKIRQMMMLSAATIGIAGIVLGCGMGAAISMVITHVINKISFGWEVPFQMPVLTLAVLISGLFVTTLLAGIVPFLIARKIDPKQFISFE